MVAAASEGPHESANVNSSDLCVKMLAESSTLKSVPSEFTYVNDSKGSYSDSIPIIDFSQLTSANPHQRSNALQKLAKACEEWGFFVVGKISQFP